MLHIIRLLLLVAAVSACSPVVYGPNFQSIPALEEAGDISIAGQYGTGNYLGFTDVSLAYAVAPRLAFMVNGSYAMVRQDINTEFRGKGHYFEPAFGLFSVDIPRMRFSLYGAYGFGQQIHFLQSGGHIPIKWNRYFMLPAVEFRLRWLSFGLSSRVGYLIFDDGITALEQVYRDNDFSTQINPNRKIQLLEPAFTMSGYFGPFRLSSQFIMLRNSNMTYPFDIFYFGFGLNYTHSKRGKYRNFRPF